MQYRKLGQTDIEASTVGLGTWQFAGDWAWGPQDEGDSVAAVLAALDQGISLFDTAEGYGAGKSEQILGKALKTRRSEAVIATKVSGANLRPADLRAACQRSLRALDTEWIDLYQIHWPNWDIPLADTIGALKDLRSEGLIRALGLSNFGPRDLTDFIEAAGTCTSNQLPYSLLWRAIEFELQAQCVRSKTSILCYSPLAQGLLSGKFGSADEVPEGRARTRSFSTERPLARHGEPGQEQETFAAIERIRQIAAQADIPMAELSLAWLLHQPRVTSVLVGGRNPSQVMRNIQAGTRDLAEDILVELDQATAPLKSALGPSIDPYQSQSRIR
jgi:aryl-alcohol dehydrogenase-like predicted oxidoreductase